LNNRFVLRPIFGVKSKAACIKYVTVDPPERWAENRRNFCRFI